MVEDINKEKVKKKMNLMIYEGRLRKKAWQRRGNEGMMIIQREGKRKVK